MNSLIELLLLIRAGNNILVTDENANGLKEFQITVATIQEGVEREYIEEPEYRLSEKYGLLEIYDQVSKLRLTVLGNNHLDSNSSGIKLIVREIPQLNAE